jgi:hypothetical protein
MRSVFKKKLDCPKKAHKNPFVPRLKVLGKLQRYGQVQHAVAAKRNSLNYARLGMPKEEWSWDN